MAEAFKMAEAPLLQFTDCWRDALYKVAMSGTGEGVLHVTDELVIMKDKFPKSQVHLLVLPRDSRLVAIDRLTCDDIPLLRKMEATAWEWLEANRHLVLTEQHKYPVCGELKFMSGYHAVPSMKQMHLHVFSTDMMKYHRNVRHYNTFTTPYLRTTENVCQELLDTGCVVIPVYKMSHLEAMINVSPTCNRVGCGQCCNTTRELQNHFLECTHKLPGKEISDTSNKIQTEDTKKETFPKKKIRLDRFSK
eukprot:TRINITY_DN20039_c0_g1_i1.p1 TRINITY_DN20039_c0_g1~~TRINITY_DN20039_c0_g1_i1.p1  ORF type:complete len:262 (+),score=39.08 TRINITY_DN20039_c0_g1_i1:41-787(+)